MNVQFANFEDLLAFYYYGTSAHEAASYLTELIRRERHDELRTLLRDYRERAITSSREIELRAATDRLLSCCSIMEIASLSDFVAELQETDFASEMRIVLEDRYVRRYYQEYYPTKLPQLFRYRLMGSNRAVEPAEQATSNILEFLDLDRRFSEKLEDRYLLRMLDSFKIEGYWFSDVVEIVGRPEEFINRLLLPSEERDVVSEALNEFGLFMQFCFDFRRLLTVVDQPLLRSVIWNHYSYWFDIIGDKLRRQLGDALERFLEWRPEGKESQAAEEIQEYVREGGAVLRVLTSREFAGPVDEFLERLSRS